MKYKGATGLFCFLAPFRPFLALKLAKGVSKSKTFFFLQKFDMDIIKYKT